MVNGEIPVAGSNGIIGYHNVSTPIEPCITIGRSGNVGTPYIYDKCWAHNTVLYIDDFKGNDPLYLYYLLKTIPLASYGGGSAVPTLNRNHIHPIEIKHTPSLEEQRRIAGILGAIDDKIENNRRINTNLELQAQALYKQWFVDNRSDGWEEIKLGDIIEISKKSITPSQFENTNFEHYSLPAFDDGIQPVFEKGKYIKSSKFIVEQNMFLFSKLNPRIKRIWLPDIQTENAICSTEFIPYKPKDIAMFGFCYSIVNSDSFYEYVLSLTNGSTGSHQRFHPIDTLDYELMIPNNDYIAKFEELVMPIYRTIARNRMECKNLASLRDTLLPKLMNGEIKL
jgi:type I restriction enzyme S subunit